MNSLTDTLNIEVEDTNFDFLKLDTDLSDLYEYSFQAEIDYALKYYYKSLINIRKSLSKLIDIIITINYDLVPRNKSLTDKISFLEKNEYRTPDKIIKMFYEIEDKTDEKSSISSDEELAFKILSQLKIIYLWYFDNFTEIKIKRDYFIKPRIVSRYKNNQERKVIYIQSVNNNNWPAYKGARKIGETTTPENELEVDWNPNSQFLHKIVRNRLNNYMRTAGVPSNIEWAELAWIKDKKKWFSDKEVHEVLRRSGYKLKKGLEGTEWFNVDLKAAKDAISAVKSGKTSLKNSKQSVEKIELRKEQMEAVNQAVKAFRKYNRVLWNAKMRFGKTLSAYQLIKEIKFNKILIVTHRPVVSDSWYEDFHKIEMQKEGYVYSSKDYGERIETLIKNNRDKIVCFASLQDLRGAEKAGGKFEKYQEIFEQNWDLIVVDEAHEGTQTELGEKVLELLTKKNTKLLELSGTPFNILSNYESDQVFTWDYIMEQQAKIRHSVEQPEKTNPYEGLPKVEMFTFKVNNDNKFKNKDKSFDFSEFFKVDKYGKFIYEKSIIAWLDNITHNSNSNYPFSTEEYRESLRHTLWLLPNRSSAKALTKVLKNHPIFKDYNIVNVVDDNDNNIIYEGHPDLLKVRNAIGAHPSKTKTIILTVRKLTTGVNIPELNAVVFLNNTTSVQNYLQAAFRAQTPFSDKVLGMKKKAYIFDFAPDRALNILAKSLTLSPGKKILDSQGQNEKIKELLNFLPVLGQTNNVMKPYSMNKMMRQLKKAYAEKAVLSGFDDSSIYNDSLWNVTKDDISLFNYLNGKLGKTKQEKKGREIDINDNGLDEKERQKARRGKRKPKKKRTQEEIDAINAENKMKENRKNMILILRGVSIRIPLMIYGMNIDLDSDITLDEFTSKVDDISWEEFMPEGITKLDFVKMKKFYDPEVFIEAGHRIRQAAITANNMSYQDRLEKIVTIFSGFKNPDKETVLTPWRVVNLHLGKTVGGFNFYDENFKNPLKDGKYREIDLGYISKEVFNEESKILEINSKTGLYPLYIAFSIYQKRFQKESLTWEKNEFIVKDKKLWQEVLANNIYAINKTPMAKTITYRTLNGYEKNLQLEKNLVYIEDLPNKVRGNKEEAIEQIKEKFGGNAMKFDIVVGNPPYHKSTTVNNRQTPIYHHFYEIAECLSDKYSLISPARFLFNAGLTPKYWNEKMLNDHNVKVEEYFSNSEDVFPNADIRGGIAIIYRDINKKYSPIKKFIPNNVLRGIVSKVPVDEKNSLTSIMHGGRSALKFNELFLENYPNIKNDRLTYIQKKRPDVKKLGKNEEYEIKSSAFESIDYVFKENKPNNEIDYYKILGLYDKERAWRWIEKKYLYPRHQQNNVNKWKVFIAKANEKGNFGEILSTPIVGKPGESTTPTFISIGAFNTKQEAENLLKYIKTKFARCLLSVLKITQDNPPSKWIYIPLQDFSESSDIEWCGSIRYIDEQLYSKYNLDIDEIDYIEKNVREMK